MTDLFQYIQSRSTVKLADQPVDYYFEMLNEWNDRHTGTIMPPSPGVQAYTISYTYDAGVFSYSLDVEWREITKWLVKNIEPWQITHRSRQAVAALSPLRVYEQQLKIRNLKEWRNQMLRHSLSSPQSEAIYSMFWERIKSHLKFDRTYLAKFARDRPRSSLGEGWKWTQAMQMPLEEWRTWFDIVSANIEDLSNSPYKYANIRWNTGLRARSNPITSFSDVYNDKIERTRIIQFHPYLSPLNAFIPGKKEAFSQILQDVMDYIGVQGVFHFPYVEGGGIYLKAAELFSAGYNFKALDGKSWEASVGTLMGPAFSTLMMHLDGVDLLPSGGFHTSIVGTMANVIQNRNLDGELIVLGDDMNYFYKGKSHIGKVPWVEESPGDTKHRYILGTSYEVDPMQPRLSGLKVMSDRASKMIPFNFEDGSGQQAVIRKRDPRQISTWAGMYLGWYGDDTLINQLRKLKIEDRDYFSPSEIMEDLIESGIDIDPFKWAEDRGVKNLVVV
jgi:hypothetical protein